MKKIIKKALLPFYSKKLMPGDENYFENNYKKSARTTSEEYQDRLTSWQIPAIKKHCGDLTGKVFIDIGAGDIVLAEKLPEIGIPKIFYAQDLNQFSLDTGLNRLKEAGISIDNLKTLSSDNFNFDLLPENSVDYAFSNSLFSHLNINSILLCLRNLSPKMKKNAKYFSSMIVLPEGEESTPYDWSYLETKGTNVISQPTRDPYHYTDKTIFLLSSFETGFTVNKIHDYGHPFQKLVEFQRL